jgi:hypothetical protein
MEQVLLRNIALPSFNLGRIRRRWSTDLRASVAAFVLTAICLTGCSAETTKQVIADIAVQIPLAQAVVTTTAAAAEGIDPAASLLIANAANTAQVGLTALQTLCTAYAQSPSTTVLASITAALNTLLNTNATALLNAANIVDPSSRAIAQASLGALQTALLLVSVIMQRTQSTTQVAATAASRTYKLREVAPYLDHQQVQQATGLSFNTALSHEEARGF